MKGLNILSVLFPFWNSQILIGSRRSFINLGFYWLGRHRLCCWWTWLERKSLQIELNDNPFFNFEKNKVKSFLKPFARAQPW